MQNFKIYITIFLITGLTFIYFSSREKNTAAVVLSPLDKYETQYSNLSRDLATLHKNIANQDFDLSIKEVTEEQKKNRIFNSHVYKIQKSMLVTRAVKINQHAKYYADPSKNNSEEIINNANKLSEKVEAFIKSIDPEYFKNLK